MTHNPPPRQVPVNWDDLEWAFTSHTYDWAFYLDRHTGQVERASQDPLQQLQQMEGDLSEGEVEAGLEEGRLIPIDPLPASVEYQWMADFADSVADRSLRDQLCTALDGRGAFRRFKNVLRNHPGERARWFAFRDDRLHHAAREWLAKHDLAPTTAPPRRHKE